MTELFDELDENGKKTGRTITREQAHGEGYWHSAVYVWIYNNNNEIMVQKRSMNKDAHPGNFDISVAGQIPSGETALETALRELKEEVALEVTSDNLENIGIKKEALVSSNGKPDKQFGHNFLFNFKGDKSKLSFNKEEIESLKWISLEEFRRQINDAEEFKNFVPHTREYYLWVADEVEKAISTNELFDELDDTGKKTGRTITREQAHTDGYWHSVVHMWIYNSKGEILLEKRSESKDTNPGKYDISASGHIESGEEVIDVAIREMKEEVSIDAGPKDLIDIGVIKEPLTTYGGKRDNHFSYVFLMKYDGDISDINFDKEEIESLEWISLEEFRKQTTDPEESKNYVHHSKEYYQWIADEVEKVISSS